MASDSTMLDDAWFVPVTRAPVEGVVDVLLKPTTDGGRAFLVFSSLEVLVESCGKGQHWVALGDDALESVVRDSGADSVGVDVVLDAEQQFTGEVVPDGRN